MAFRKLFEVAVFSFDVLFICTINTGNLPPKTSKEDLAHHFGLDATPYLRSSSWIELAVEPQSFAFINVPEHFSSKFHLLFWNTYINIKRYYHSLVKFEKTTTYYVVQLVIFYMHPSRSSSPVQVALQRLSFIWLLFHIPLIIIFFLIIGPCCPPWR